MKQVLAKSLIAIGCASTIVGCSSVNPNAPTPNQSVTQETEQWFPLDPSQPDRNVAPGNLYEEGNTVTIEGKTYFLDKSGQLVLSDGELESLKKKGVKVYNPRPISGIELDAQELGALMQDEDAFFAFIKNPDYHSPGKVSFVAKQGDLRENMERLASNNRIDHFRWELDYSFYLPETKVITANSFNELLGTMTRGFPIEAELTTTKDGKSLMRVFSIDGIDKRISFVVSEGSLKANFERLSDLAGWNDQWEFDHDFHVPSTLVIRGATYRDVLKQMLQIQNYPIVAEEAR